MTASHARILALHAFYQIPGGEDQVHRTEVDHLRERGHEVLDLTVENAALAQLGTASRLRATVSNPATGALVAQAIDRFHPDVAYVNNTFPGLSASALDACRRARVPLVRVLHNYRFTCVSANLRRDGEFCDACVGDVGERTVSAKIGLPGILHGCYRDSRAISAVSTAARIADRRASRGAQVIAISGYVRDIAIRAGLDPVRITVRPNLTLPSPATPAPTGSEPNTPAPTAPTIVFAGRDTPEKGLPVLLDAFARLRKRRPDARLQVIGPEHDEPGPGDALPGVEWLGRLPHDQVTARMAAASVVAVPSVWPEPFGLVAVEALAAGTPVVASASGGLAELGGAGVTLHAPGDAADLAARLDEALEGTRDDARIVARARYDADFSADTWYRITLRALGAAMA